MCRGAESASPHLEGIRDDTHAQNVMAAGRVCQRHAVITGGRGPIPSEGACEHGLRDGRCQALLGDRHRVALPFPADLIERQLEHAHRRQDLVTAARAMPSSNQAADRL